MIVCHARHLKIENSYGIGFWGRIQMERKKGETGVESLHWVVEMAEKKNGKGMKNGKKCKRTSAEGYEKLGGIWRRKSKRIWVGRDGGRINKSNSHSSQFRIYYNHESTDGTKGRDKQSKSQWTPCESSCWGKRERIRGPCARKGGRGKNTDSLDLLSEDKAVRSLEGRGKKRKTPQPMPLHRGKWGKSISGEKVRSDEKETDLLSPPAKLEPMLGKRST